MSDLREKLADQEHERWSSWMIYMFSKGKLNNDGTWTMPEWAVERWSKQAGMKYGGLSEKEKDSDRKEADETIALIETQLSTYKDVEICARAFVNSCDNEGENGDYQFFVELKEFLSKLLEVKEEVD